MLGGNWNGPNLPSPAGSGRAGSGFGSTFGAIAGCDGAATVTEGSGLEQSGWIIDGPRGAAKILNLHPNTLRSRMRKLGIVRAPHESQH